MTIEELIKKLPQEYQEIAYRYTAILLDEAFDDLQGWIELIAKGKWQDAYRRIIEKMPTNEVIADEQRGHEILKRLNKNNAERIGAQFAIIEQILLTSMLMLRKEIET
ncbi:hypothetical protein LCGC14_0390640 [marine sediment metagenome]|uniref:Uncharacterized protein n=1 Tax=marine sediment metagenome TaxID=412755 RepID=A0A0F9T5J0_9ZZZZ